MHGKPILVSGGINLDITYRLRWEDSERHMGGTVPRGGEVILREGAAEILAWLGREATPVGMFPGGSAGNTAAALARLGVPTALCGQVGEDEAGAFLLASHPGVDLSRVRRGGSTGRCVILVDETGERSILKLPGANELWDPEHPGASRTGGWGGIHLTSLSVDDGPRRQARLLALAGPAPFVSLDPGEIYASRGRSAIRDILSVATHLFVNRRELRLLFGEPPDRGALLASPRRVAMVKMGADGLVLDGVEGHAEVPAHPVAAVDATGAGDAAAAGYIAAEGLSLPLAVRASVAAWCGARAVSRPGREGYPDADLLGGMLATIGAR